MNPALPHFKRLFATRLLFAIVVFSTCGHKHAPGHKLGYDLTGPDMTYALPGKLKEISGLCVYRKNKVACVQDEKGNVYVYDLKKDEVKESVEFGKNHDYEGIANVHDTLYVLQSTGVVFEIDGFDTDNQRTTTHRTFLSKVNNAEGLCYDSMRHRLLIACKGMPFDSTQREQPLNLKTIYAFDLATKALNPRPAFVLSYDSVQAFIDQTLHRKTSRKFVTGKDGEMFAPSELAVHPLTHDVYVLASVGKRLIVLDENGSVKAVEPLDPKLFAQPEGLAFFPNGDMLISNEGKKKAATILRFDYEPRR